MKRLALLAALLALACAGFTVDATTTQAARGAVEACQSATPAQLHAQNLARLARLEHHGYTLTHHARLVQAGVAVKRAGITGHLMAVPTRTLAMQPPHNEYPDGGGFYALTAPGLYLGGIFFPYGIQIIMGCPAGGSAWTGAPPGDTQAGIAVHADGGVSNETFAHCPGAAYGNCLFDWEANDVGYGVAFLWVTGRYTTPMYVVGWTVCH